jgi:hypothetical protein
VVAGLAVRVVMMMVVTVVMVVVVMIMIMVVTMFAVTLDCLSGVIAGEAASPKPQDLSPQEIKTDQGDQRIAHGFELT